MQKMNRQMTYKTNVWQAELKNAVTDPDELLQLLALDSSLLDQARAAAALFPFKAPRGFIQRIRKGDLNDPLLRQILPLGLELESHPGFTSDPLAEQAANKVPGLLHKYAGRVLLTLTKACAIHCRYCFRREFPYADNNPGSSGWLHALAYIDKDPSISEVILSGGDPLVVNDLMLAQFLQKLQAIPHIKRIRIHTRLPIVLPSRITPELISLFTTARCKIIMVVHCNHPQEINDEVISAIQSLTHSNITLLNQTVLLKGINDNVETLVTLSETLFAAGILPYYLHILDKVNGVAHFDLDREIAQRLHQGLQQRCPGYLVPKLVIEQAGAPSKIPLQPFDFYTGE